MKLFELGPSPLNRALARAFGAVTTVRNLAYDHGWLEAERFPILTVCVGNITVGGSGKSPFAQYLVRGFLARGGKPVLLSRGYRGSEDGPYLVRGDEKVDQLGDEALMHRAELPTTVPVVVARRRAAGVKFSLATRLGNVVILDDGFQHRRLDRDVNLLLCDNASLTNGFYRQERLVPAGRLREKALPALLRADAIIVDAEDGASEIPSHLHVGGRDIPIFRFRVSARRVVDVFSCREVPQEVLRRRPLTLIAGIERPERFFSLAASLGIQSAGERSFPDHFRFTSGIWKKLKQHAPILCTAKDAVKLRKFTEHAGELFSLVIDVSIIEADEEAFWNFLDRREQPKEQIANV